MLDNNFNQMPGKMPQQNHLRDILTSSCNRLIRSMISYQNFRWTAIDFIVSRKLILRANPVDNLRGDFFPSPHTNRIEAIFILVDSSAHFLLFSYQLVQLFCSVIAFLILLKFNTFFCSSFMRRIGKINLRNNI